MKKLPVLLVLVMALVLMVSNCQRVEDPIAVQPLVKNQGEVTTTSGCTTIQEGTLLYSASHYLGNQPLMIGYDPFGYNYQASMFRGSYANVYLGGDGFPPYDGDAAAYELANPGVVGKWYWPYRDTSLLMQWNDAWISNTDCDGDGKLDRHYGFTSYIGSGAWLTNHQSDKYGVQMKNRIKDCKWVYFVKIVAAPSDATLTDGVWYRSDGTEIGPEIWGSFAEIQSVYNDPCAGAHGVEYLSPAGPGFGQY